jgi:hypothetical protein
MPVTKTDRQRERKRGESLLSVFSDYEPKPGYEAVASYDLWIWHSILGLPCSHNDINVLEPSFLFSKVTKGHVPLANYSIN